MTTPSKTLNPKLLPLVELLARKAFEAHQMRQGEKPRSLPEHPAGAPAVSNRRPAA